MTTTVAEWESDPLAPTIVTVYVPVASFLTVDIFRVVVPEPPGESEKVLVFNDSLGPVGETDDDRDPVPANPLRLVNVIVMFPS